jgi:signal transduction histidine kinase/CheY-like chemotaxis protein
MGGRAASIRVLHVDDDPAFAELAATFLEREDDRIEVLTATSAEAGLDRLDEGIDCIVSDYDMPGLNGIEFLERVRAADDDRPFVLFTGKGSEEIASEAISAGVTDYVQKSPGNEQYEILVNRIVNAVEARRVRERAIRQEHINTLIREINRRLVAAGSVDEIEAAVCRTLTDATPFRFAWIGEPNPDTGEIVPRTSAGDAADYLTDIDVYYDDRPLGRGPGGRAVRTGELQVTRVIPDDPGFEPWREAAERYGYESMVVVPLSYGGGRDGILALYADQPNAFDETELSVFEELGETISRALEAAEIRRRLESRRAAETTRRERYYRTLVDALPNGAVALFDADLRYTIVGGTVFDDLDLSPSDMEGESLTDVHSPAFREAFLPHYRAALDGAERTFDFEYADRQFEAHVAPVRDEAGDIVGGLSMTQEVTERAAREQELRRRERALRGMYEAVAAPDRSITDRIRRLLEIGTDTLGVRYGILGRVEDGEFVFELVHAADGSRIGDGAITEGDAVPLSAANCERVIRTDEAVTVGDVSAAADLAARPPYAEYGLSCYVGTPVVVGEETYGTLCFYDDDAREDGFSDWEVTVVDLLSRWIGAALGRRERTAKLRTQNDRFREFTGIVSHDLRNPMAVLRGSLELAEETGDDEQFDRCRRALDRMDALVEDLTTLTREGAVVDEAERLGLDSIARACWETVETGEATLRVVDETTIRADEARLRQLLENLFRNSVEHGSTGNRTESGDAVEHGSTSPRSQAPEDSEGSEIPRADGEAVDSVEHGSTGNRTGVDDGPLTVRVGVLDDGFYVEDDGVGIPEDRRAEVFERGYSTEAAGTGLGLSIVEKMAAAHGWTVAVTEGSAGGARIEVRGVDLG